MEPPFSFEPLLVFGFLSIVLLVGVVLRANVHFFQRFLFPSCLIGGLLGLILVSTRLIDLSASKFETFAYHFFNISFISVGLTRGKNRKENLVHTRSSSRGLPGWHLSKGLHFPFRRSSVV